MALKFSIVTPAYNSERYISETIDSVIRQRGDFSIEYIILDNNSIDSTRVIVERYQELLSTGKIAISCNAVQLLLISERDSGMYDAIKKGFSVAHGDVYAWINSDDIYLPGAFDVIQRTLERYPEIYWIKGITSYMNENSTIYAAGRCNLYRQDWIKAGHYGTSLYFIQQDSVFWRADLLKNSSGIDTSLHLAGDYFLWKSFSERVPLYSVNAFVSCFRKVKSQKSEDISAYWQEIERRSPLDKKLYNRFKIYFSFLGMLHRTLRPFLYRLLFGRDNYHLVTLNNNVTPCLINGSYYELKDRI